MKKRTIALMAALMILAGCIVGGTIAWLTDKTDSVQNTFTVGNIDIELEETTTDFKMVPGNKIAKDPKVTVEAKSEDCWLFVKVEKSAVLDQYITYAVDNKWTALTGVDGVYYREVAAADADQEFAVLKDNEVTVNKDVTKEMMDALEAEGSELPTLTFTAYAVQKANIASAAEAWETLFPTTP